MRVLFDLRSAQYHLNRGIGYYCFSLLDSLLKIKEINFSFLISNKYPFPVKKYKDYGEIFILENFDNYYIKENFDFFLSSSLGVLDIYLFSTKPIIDTLFPPEVIKYCNQLTGILYDLNLLLLCGSFFETENQRKLYTLSFENIKFSDHFFCISDFTKKDGIEKLARNKSDFTTIYGGVSQDKKHMKTPSDYVWKDRKNHIVNISGNIGHKNYIGMATAFAKAYHEKKIPQDAKLYLVCSCNDTYVQAVKNAIKPYNLKMGKQVIATNFISDEELSELLVTAKACIHPSYAEGLGLPILEAYALNTPAFASNTTAMKELVLPECSFDPTEIEEIKEAVIKIFTDEELCNKSVLFGKEILKTWNWDNSAKILYHKLQELKQTYSKQERIAFFTQGNEKPSKEILKLSSSLPVSFDIFADFHTFKQMDSFKKIVKNQNIFPLVCFNDFKRKYAYSSKIFTIGDFPSHINILKTSMQLKNEKNNYLLLENKNFINLFFCFCGQKLKNFKEFLEAWYPNIFTDISELNEEKDFVCFSNILQKNNILCFRPLFHLTAVQKVICLTDEIKKYIQKELSKPEINYLEIKDIQDLKSIH